MTPYDSGEERQECGAGRGVKCFWDDEDEAGATGEAGLRSRS